MDGRPPDIAPTVGEARRDQEADRRLRPPPERDDELAPARERTAGVAADGQAHAPGAPRKRERHGPPARAGPARRAAAAGIGDGLERADVARAPLRPRRPTLVAL